MYKYDPANPETARQRAGSEIANGVLAEIRRKFGDEHGPGGDGFWRLGGHAGHAARIAADTQKIGKHAVEELGMPAEHLVPLHVAAMCRGLGDGPDGIDESVRRMISEMGTYPVFGPHDVALANEALLASGSRDEPGEPCQHVGNPAVIPDGGNHGIPQRVLADAALAPLARRDGASVLIHGYVDRAVREGLIEPVRSLAELERAGVDPDDVLAYLGDQVAHLGEHAFSPTHYAAELLPKEQQEANGAVLRELAERFDADLGDRVNPGKAFDTMTWAASEYAQGKDLPPPGETRPPGEPPAPDGGSGAPPAPPRPQAPDSGVTAAPEERERVVIWTPRAQDDAAPEPAVSTREPKEPAPVEKDAVDEPGPVGVPDLF
jgi:hypothetical protein